LNNLTEHAALPQ